MASYTMTLSDCLKTFLANKNVDTTSLTLNQMIEEGRKLLFSFNYPIFDVTYKSVFETHFIRHFFMREIGFETEELFQFYLETWLSINMPYFNKLFESEQIKFDPLINAKMETSHTTTKDVTQTQDSSTNGNSTQTSSGTNTNNNFNRQMESTTPENRLAITTQDGAGVIEYASSIEESTDKNTATSSGEGSSTSDVTSNANVDVNETETYIQNRTGKIGVQSYSKLLNEYRDSFLRIEKNMFKEMNELFMLVY